MFSLIIFLCTLIGVWSQSFENTVAIPGGQVTFNCTVGGSLNTNWVLDVDLKSGTGTRIATGCKVLPSFTENYAAENGSNFCNLIIRNVNLRLSGTYSCVNSNTGTRHRALLSVIEQNAEIRVLNRTTLWSEGDSVNISCDLTYSSTFTPDLPRLIPSLSWKMPNGQIATVVISDTEPNSIISIVTVLLQRPELPIIQCTVNFTIYGDVSDSYATNIPSSPVASWDTPMKYRVLTRTCKMAKVAIANSGICRLSNLSCVASSNMPTNYSWVDVTDPQPWNSLNNTQFFPFAEDGRTYLCTAHYVIGVTEQTTQCNFTVANISKSPQPCRIVHGKVVNIYTTDTSCNNKVRPVSCNCKNGTYGSLVCKAANVFPEPTYRWEDEDGTFLGNGSSYNATLKGTIKCVALTAFPEVNASSSEIVSVTDCCPVSVLIKSFIMQWVGGCIIATVVFTVCHFVLVESFRAKMNYRFQWLQLMLPYGSKAPAISEVPSWKKYVFVPLFFVIAPTCGVVFFPVLVTLAYRCPKVRIDEVQELKESEPSNSLCLIISMWIGVTALVFPLAFVLVYIIPCKQMTFQVFIGD